VFLSITGEPMPVTFTTLQHAIRSASFVPWLTFLNLCDSYDLALALHRCGHTTTGWPGPADDGQCRLFARQLYRALVRGETLASATASATMMLVAANLKLSPPILLGHGKGG
jgi:hypothetical protein